MKKWKKILIKFFPKAQADTLNSLLYLIIP